MSDLFHAIVIAVIQGVTELFPVSSLGHAVILPHLFGWSVDQSAPTFLPFLVLLHVGTALALLLYFWRDWWLLLSSLLGRGPDGAKAESRRVLLLLVLGTIPAGLIGLIFRNGLAGLFSCDDAPAAPSSPRSSRGKRWSSAPARSSPCCPVFRAQARRW